MAKFDDAVPLALGLLREKFSGETADELSIHIVRDLTGQLIVVLPDNALEESEWNPLAAQLNRLLGSYSPGESRVLLRESDLVDSADVIQSPEKIRLDWPNAWLVDRLLTNQDWVRQPLQKIPPIPTAVAYSVKGGVGRSTAFSMFAWHLARKGKNVLVIDLDLEAPGICSILLNDLPERGLIDWLIENINGQGTKELLTSAIAEAPIGFDTDGKIRVLAAYGKTSANYISKLGRVYGTSLDAKGNMIGLADRLLDLLRMIAVLEDAPEVILIDSRAGLHDIGSAVVTRLGAEVFLFARNDDQDWWSYHQLFDHLRVSQSVSMGMGSDDDLRWKLKMVAAQTNPTDAARREWVSRSYTEWTDFYDDESASPSEAFEPHPFAKDDSEAPHTPLFVNFDAGVRAASLSSPDDRPNWEFVHAIFGEFFAGAEQRLWPENPGGEL